MSQLKEPAIAAIAIVIGVLLGLLLAWSWRWYRSRRARLALVATITGIGVDHVRDVIVPDGNGGFHHVDYALLTPRGILIIDVRDVSGNVFGSDQMSHWTVMDGAQRTTFPNPQPGLYDRIASVRQFGEQLPVDGRVVFTRRASFPKGLPRFALGIDALGTEFPPLDRDTAERAAAAFRGAWDRFKAGVQPSPLVNPKSVVDN